MNVAPVLGFATVSRFYRAQLSPTSILKQHDVGVIRCGDDGICGGENAQVSSPTEDVRKFCVSGMSHKQLGLVTNSGHTGRTQEDASGGLRCTSKTVTKNGKRKLIGGVIGGSVCLGILLAMFVWFLRHKRRSRVADPTVEPFSEVPSTDVSKEEPSMPLMTRMRGVRTKHGSSTSVTNVGATTDVIDISNAEDNTGEPLTVPEVFQLQIILSCSGLMKGTPYRNILRRALPAAEQRRAPPPPHQFHHQHLLRHQAQVMPCPNLSEWFMSWHLRTTFKTMLPHLLTKVLKSLLKPIAHRTQRMSIRFMLDAGNLFLVTMVP